MYANIQLWSVRVNDRPIAVFDSGVGGLPYLQSLRKYAPHENFVYLADRAHFPYGEKSDQELRDIIVQAVARFIDETNPKLMLIACNTASVVALDALRRHFDIPFIGVVPAIKPAAEISVRRAIGVLATRRTVEDPYTENLITQFAADCKVIRYAGVEIVDLVELDYFTTTAEQKAAVLRPAVDFFETHRVDTLVVGCTHFIFVEELLHHMLNGTAEVIDSREGVTQQALRMLNKNNIARTAPAGVKPVQNRFFVSGKGLEKAAEKRYKSFAQLYNLEWSGLL